MDKWPITRCRMLSSKQHHLYTANNCDNTRWLGFSFMVPLGIVVSLRLVHQVTGDCTGQTSLLCRPSTHHQRLSFLFFCHVKAHVGSTGLILLLLSVTFKLDLIGLMRRRLFVMKRKQQKKKVSLTQTLPDHPFLRITPGALFCI